MAAALTPATMTHQQLLAHPMVTEDKNTVATLTATSGLVAKVKQIKAFANDNPEVVLRFKRHSVNTAFAVSIVGTFVGGAINPVLIPKFAVGGFALGLATGAIDSVISIKRDRLFQIWKEREVPGKLYTIFEKYLPNNHDDFICPITQDLIRIPVVDPHGHIFEESQITRHIQSHGGKTLCPMRGRGEITINDLNYDFTYHPRVLTQLRPAFDAATSDPETVRAALEFRERVVDANQELLSAELAPKVQEVVSGKISAKEFAEFSEAASKKYKIA